jgi:uncharacterized protein YdhG (YjbR/CyaY superfamily)
MQSTAATVDEYLASLPEDRRETMTKLRKVIKKNIPKGFEECMSYGMIGYVVPHSIYPAGYHCTPNLPLPFANIASQKNFISFYHMSIYGDPTLKTWFEEEYKKSFTAKLDMGKSCTRFKKMEHIPYELIGELMQKITPAKWIETYEKLYKSNLKK